MPAVRREALEALLLARERLGVDRHHLPITDASALALDPERGRVAAAANDGTLLLRDLGAQASSRLRTHCPAHGSNERPVDDLTFLRGTLLLIQCALDRAVVLDTGDGEVRAEWASSARSPAVVSGDYVATVEEDRVTVRSVSDLAVVRTIEHEGLLAVAFDPRAECVYTGSQAGQVRRWTADTGAPDATWSVDGAVAEIHADEPCGTPTIVAERLSGLAVRRAGDAWEIPARHGFEAHLAREVQPLRIAIGEPRRVRIGPIDGGLQAMLEVRSGDARHLALSPNSRQLLTIDGSGRARLFGASRTAWIEDEPIGGALSLGDAPGATRALVLSERWAAAASGAEVTLWDLHAAAFWPLPNVRVLSFGPRGSLAAISPVGGAHRLSAGATRRIAPPVAHPSAAFLPGGELLLAGSEGIWRIGDAASTRLPQSRGSWAGVGSVDGVIVGLKRGGTVSVWPTRSGEPVRAELPPGRYRRLEAHAGARMATAVGGETSYALRWRDGALQSRALPPIDGRVVFSTDRTGRVHGALDGGDVLVRNAGGEPVRFSSGAEIVMSGPLVSPDGRWIAALGVGSVLLWEVSGVTVPIVVDVGGSPTTMAWHVESDRLAVATLDSVRVLDLRPGVVIESGCRLLASPRLTRAERRRYLPRGLSFRNPCEAAGSR